MNKEKFLEKLSDSNERVSAAKALDRASLCVKNYEKTFTEFLNPFFSAKLADFVEKETNLNVKCFGGSDGCERVIVAFAPDYDEIEYADFPIVSLKIEYKEKFSKKLTHRDFLGSLMGLGIVREKIGDIVVKEGYAVVFVSDDIADYICVNLSKVSHTSVKCEKTVLKDDFSVFSEVKDQNINVASLRLDCVISAAFKIARSEAAVMIKSGKVFIDWKCEESPSRNVGDNMVITARGKGRIKVDSVTGKTKKDRIVLNIKNYK